MKIILQSTIKITPTSPFNFDATFHKPSHFPSDDNYWQPDIKWQTWFWRKEQLGLKFENTGNITKPCIKISVYSKHKLDTEFIESLRQEIIFRYNLDLDLKEFYSQLSQDKILDPLIKHWNGLKPGHQNSLYEYLIIGIVLQNATVRRSINMLKVLFENYGKLLSYDGRQLWCFWEPGALKRVSELELRSLKIGYRAKYIKKIDDQFSAGEIDEFALRSEDFTVQKQELLNLFGVGPATVWYLLFDVFHHYDFFEHISPWEQKIYSKLFFNQDPEKPVPVKQLLKYFKRFGKYRQLAVHYVWEDIWWKRKNDNIPWLEKLIRT